MKSGYFPLCPTFQQWVGGNLVTNGGYPADGLEGKRLCSDLWKFHCKCTTRSVSWGYVHRLNSTLAQDLRHKYHINWLHKTLVRSSLETVNLVQEIKQCRVKT